MQNNIVLPDMRAQYNFILDRVVGIAQHFAGKSALRNYQYQVITSNGCQNDEAGAVVGWVSDYLLFGLINGRYGVQNMMGSLDGIVEFVLKAHCSRLLQMNSMLLAQLPPDAAPDAQNSMNQLMNDLSMLAQYRQQSNQFVGQQPMQPMVQQPMNNGMQQQAPFNPNQINQGNRGFAHQPQQNHFHRPASPAARQPHQLGSHHGTESGHNQAPQAQRATERTWGNKRDAPPVVLTWAPSTLQPYPLLTNNRTETIVLGVNNGVTVMNSQPLEPNNMDRSQHQLTHAAQVVISAQGMSYEKRREVAENSLRAISTASNVEKIVTEDKRNKTLSDLTNRYMPEIFETSTLTELIFDMQFFAMGRFGVPTDASAVRMDGALRRRFCLVENAEHEADEKLLIERELTNAVEAGTYDALRNAISNIHAKGNLSTKAMAVKLDKYLADELNHFTSTQLGFADTIDSFVDDLQSLVNAIQNKLGSIYVEALGKFQPRFIDMLVGGFKVHGEIQMLESGSEDSLLEQSEVQHKLAVLDIKKLVSVTSLGIYNSELDITFTREGANLIQTSTHPLLHEFVRSVTDDRGRVSNEVFAHHYMVTADDVIYELHKGIMGQDNYLISKVN